MALESLEPAHLENHHFFAADAERGTDRIPIRRSGDRDRERNHQGLQMWEELLGEARCVAAIAEQTVDAGPGAEPLEDGAGREGVLEVTQRNPSNARR